MSFQLQCGCGCKREAIDLRAYGLSTLLFQDGHAPKDISYTCLVCGASLTVDLTDSPDVIASKRKRFLMWELLHAGCMYGDTMGAA